MKTLESTLYNLLQTAPFFANFLLGSQVVYNDPKVARAACFFRDNRIGFIFNTEWFDSIKPEERCAVLAHEIMHVLLDHVSNRSYGITNRMAKNYAMDCAINQYIKNLPGDCVTLESMSKLCKKDLAPFETYEYYYHQLKSAVEDSGEGHDHDAMDGDGEVSDGEAAMRRAIVRDMANRSVKAAAGNVPDGVASMLAELNKNGKVNWKQQLRNLISSSRVVQTKPSRMKVHRRFELDQPGRKKDRKLVLGVCVDSSGSVSDEQFQSFMTEIYHIAKSTSITYLIHADCIVQKVDVIKGGKAKAGVLTSRAGGGGTAYQPSITKCTELKCDAIVMFGDFDCADTPKDPHVPFIWVGVGNQPPPANFGRVLRIGG